MKGLYPSTVPAESPPHPDCTGRCFASPRQSDLSPQAERGKQAYAAPSRIGGWNDNAVSQGKKIQVSCDTSVMKVSTSGRPFGLA